MATPDPLADRLARLRARYLAALPERASDLRASSVGAGGRDTLLEAAHRLAGSAALHGLPAIADQARALEAACRAGAPGPELRVLAQRLATALDAAAPAR